MYKPKIFSEDRVEVLIDFIKNHPLGLIISSDMEASLIPINVYFEGEKNILRCHLARANTQLESFKLKDSVLIVFTGQHSYVSPGLYPTKKIHGKVVPTWNYLMVQVKGAARVIDDANWVMKQITDLTDQLESNKEHPWKVDDAPSDFIRSQLKAIVGVEIIIESIEGKFKVSQNQPDENRESVKKNFQNSNCIELAEYVENYGPLKPTE